MFFSISPPLREENSSNICRVPPRRGGDLVKFLVSDSPRGRRSSQIPVKCLPYGEEIISFFDTSPPRRGGSQALFRHFSSPQGRQSCPFFDTSPPRRGGSHAPIQHFSSPKSTRWGGYYISMCRHQKIHQKKEKPKGWTPNNNPNQDRKKCLTIASAS